MCTLRGSEKNRANEKKTTSQRDSCAIYLLKMVFLCNINGLAITAKWYKIANMFSKSARIHSKKIQMKICGLESGQFFIIHIDMMKIIW